MNAKIILNTIGTWGVILIILSNATVGYCWAGDITGEFRPVDSNRIPKILKINVHVMLTFLAHKIDKANLEASLREPKQKNVRNI